MSELATATLDANTRVWRAVAIAGAGVSLLVAIGQSYPFEGRQLASVFVAVPVLVAAAVVVRAFFGDARETLLKKPDLLVPVGVVMLATTAVGSLARVPVLTPLFMANWRPKLFLMSVDLSFAVVLNITVWTAYAAWQTDLLWRYVRDGRLDSIDPTVPIRDGFWRALATLAVGVGVLLATTGVIIGTMAVPGGIMIALPALGVVGVVWNLWTAALLPVTLQTPGSVFEALGRGFRRSWDLKQYWWPQLAALLLVLGLVVVVIPNPVSFNVNAFWLGGYEHDCRWLAKCVDVLGLKPLPILVVLVDVAFLVLAIAMKLHVVRVLVAHGEPSEASDFVETNPWRGPTA